MCLCAVQLASFATIFLRLHARCSLTQWETGTGDVKMASIEEVEITKFSQEDKIKGSKDGSKREKRKWSSFV